MFSTLKWKLEIKRLRQLSKRRGQPSLPELIVGHSRHPAWRINVPGREDVYMCSPYSTGDGYVILVDALKFNIGWLQAGPGLDDSCKLRRYMPADYKFHEAVIGFKHGIENPVPLAEVSYLEWGSRAGIRFTNGMTRSFWLLAYDAPAFPIFTGCHYSIDRIHEIAGLAEPMPVTMI